MYEARQKWKNKLQELCFMSNSGQPWENAMQQAPTSRAHISAHAGRIRVGCSPDAVAEVLQGNSSENVGSSDR